MFDRTHLSPKKIECSTVSDSITITAGTLYVADQERAKVTVHYKDPERSYSSDYAYVTFGTGACAVRLTHQHLKEVIETALASMTDEDARAIVDSYLEKASTVPADVV